jgi:hypothetical protein
MHDKHRKELELFIRVSAISTDLGFYLRELVDEIERDAVKAHIAVVRQGLDTAFSKGAL